MPDSLPFMENICVSRRKVGRIPARERVGEGSMGLQKKGKREHREFQIASCIEGRSVMPSKWTSIGE